MALINRLMTDKFCPLPWIFQSVRNNGDVRVCCQANSSKSKGIYRKKDGTPYNAKFDSLESSRNSDLAKEIRKSMLENKEHEACIRCDREDRSGVVSRRNYENKAWKDTFNFEDAKKLTKSDGSINSDEIPIKYYDLRFGNLCNLKCRMCGPADSSQWFSDWVETWNKTHFNDSHGKVELIKKKNRWVAKHDDYNWFRTDYFWNQIDSNIQNIEHIYVAGGEPLLISEHYQLLQHCIDLGYAKNITVEYNTNLTNVPNKAYGIWANFKNIRIGASIDCIGKVNDYIRNPSKFDFISANLHKLDKSSGNYSVWIACTVQIYNIAYLTDFMKWVLQQNFNNVQKNKSKPFLTTHPLHKPPFLNIKALPLHTKKWIRSKFDEFYPWLENYIDENNVSSEWADAYRTGSKRLLESYYDLMMKEDWSNQLDDFWKYTDRLDEVRNESFKDVMPDLYENMKSQK